LSVIIIGGNERMERLYADTCREHGCKAKVYTKSGGEMGKKFGNAELYILFTGTVSHKMVQYALCEATRSNACVERCRSGSLSSLKNILKKYRPEVSRERSV